MTQPRGTIYLISRAPIDITYAHTIDFKNPEEQLSFWGSKIKYALTEYQYIRRERRFIQVNKTYESLDGINYLYFRSRENSKYYFAFVIEREYVNDECTRIYFEIDVLQSFMFDYTFKPSYIVQSHVDRWDNDHKPIYSRTDEGLNYGSEYVTESAYKLKPDHAVNHGFYLIYTAGLANSDGLTFTGASADSIEDWRTLINGNPIPYKLFIIPAFFGADHNKTCYHISKTISNIHEVFSFMENSSLGEYVRQIVFVPYLPFPYELKTPSIAGESDLEIEYGGVLASAVSISSGTRTIHLSFIHNITGDDLQYSLASLGIFEGIENKLPPAEEWEAIKANPLTTERDRRFESKLLCFPYRFSILTDWISTPALIKNEYLTSDKISIKGAIGYGFNTPRRFWVENYRKDPEGRECSINQLIPLEQPIISDAYYSYLLQNRNQISANLTNAKINAIASTAGGAVNGAISGGAINGAMGAVGGALTGGVSSAVQGVIGIQNMIRSENAKQADLQNLPDTISNSNDSTLAISDDSRYLTIYRKAICCEFEEQLSQYWHMFGYIVKRVEVPNLRSRMRYNYIKTLGANIEGNIESSELATIKRIYDNGLTIWHYSATDFHPLDYTYENIERKLI